MENDSKGHYIEAPRKEILGLMNPFSRRAFSYSLNYFNSIIDIIYGK